jgi:predicted DNA binding CopG/RHH family protein
MCNLRICILYQQGYYIHAGIINRSFINHVLQFLKPERYRPAMVPLDTLVPGTDVPITDTIVDPTTDDEFQAVEDDADTLSLHEEITQEAIRTVKDFLTPRMFDQLLREYSTNVTSNNSRVMMTRLRRQLAALGITMQTIKNSVLNRR